MQDIDKYIMFWTPQEILCSEITKMSKIDEILRAECLENSRQVKIVCKKGIYWEQPP